MKTALIAALIGAFAFDLYAGISRKRLIIKLKDNSNFPELMYVTGKKHLFNSYYVVYSNKLKKLKAELKLNKNISAFENDFITKQDILSPSITDQLTYSQKKQRIFNDPLVYSKWSILNSEANGISLFRTHKENITRATKKLVVAVLDTGIDFKHEDIPVWKNKEEIPRNGFDDDNNGYIDDVYGINTTYRRRSITATNNVMDFHDHGTHLAGVIGAKFQNELGVVGVATNVKIMGLKVISKHHTLSDVDMIEAIIYAVDNGAKIINTTFLKDLDKSTNALKDVIKYVSKKNDVLFITGAGNNSRNLKYFPAAPASYDIDNMLVVGSTDKYGGLSYFSNYGVKSVDIAAPGSSIYSTIRNNKYFYMSGTSIASAVVSGVAAEVWSNYPHLSAQQVKEVLLSSVTPIDVLEGRILTEGRVDLYNAIKKAEKL
tara:strand:- start:724 stop:2016 length:1293 start_codon:yes stop_codon:yes gene_type:complete